MGWVCMRDKVQLDAVDDFVVHNGVKLPLPVKRYCGPEFRSNEHYLRSAELEAERILKRVGVPANGTVLDVGCGQGRLAIGLLRKAPGVAYLGVDVDAASIDWCARHLGSQTFRFTHVNVENERYNPKGARLEAAPFRFNLADGTMHLIYAYSVFSHMTLAHIEIYLLEFKRLLRRDGTIFLTTFIEKRQGKPFEINPPGYVPISGPLHVVRFDYDFWLKTIKKAGIKMVAFDHGVESNGQSGVYLAHASERRRE